MYLVNGSILYNNYVKYNENMSEWDVTGKVPDNIGGGIH
jgi:hypothetical protein